MGLEYVIGSGVLAALLIYLLYVLINAQKF